MTDFTKTVNRRMFLGFACTILGFGFSLFITWMSISLVIVPLISMANIKGALTSLLVNATICYWIGWAARSIYRENVDTFIMKMGPREQMLYRRLLGPPGEDG